MEGTMFGELHRELRRKCYLSLRQYCKLSEQDPGNVSRIERGKVSPPKNHRILSKMAQALKLEEGSDDWENFFYTAEISAGRIPQEILSNEEVLQKLPILFRKMGGQKLKPEELDRLIEIIRRA